MASKQKISNPPVEQVTVEQALLPPIIVEPHLYILKDSGNNEFFYDPAGPSLWYGPSGSLTQYTPTVVSSPLGSLVTFSLPFPSPFPHPVPFITRTVTLVIPSVNMGNTPTQPIKTIAIFTTGRLVPFFVGQHQSYSVVDPVQGEAYA